MNSKSRLTLAVSIAVLLSILMSLTAAANPAAPSNPFVGPVRSDDTQVPTRPPGQSDEPRPSSRLTSPTPKTINAIRSVCVSWKPGRLLKPLPWL